MGSLYKCHFFPPLSTIKQSHVISLVMTFLGTKSKTMKRIQTLTWQSAKHDFAFHCPFLANKRIVNQCQHIICFMAPWIFNRFRIPDLPTYLYSRLVWAKPPIDLHLVFEKSSSKNLNFEGYTGSKNPVWNRQKIQFVILDFSKSNGMNPFRNE
jgi:hypothetical protein